MARCFPYPPPEGYLGIGGGGGQASLGGPIKPHAETEKHAKKDTEKWLKRKSCGRDKVEGTKPKRIKCDPKGGGVGSRKEGSKEEEAEISGVTEEHSLSVSTRSPSHSSESVRIIDIRPTTTDNRLETKRNVFRIKLNIPKHEEPVSTERTSQPSTSCSSQKTNDNVSERNHTIPPSTSVPWKSEKDVSAKVGKTSIHISSRSKKTSIQDLYESLTNGFTPFELQPEQSELELYEEEPDWLFASRKPGGRTSTGAQPRTVSSCAAASSCTASWPGVEVQPLPYTVPF